METRHLIKSKFILRVLRQRYNKYLFIRQICHYIKNLPNDTLKQLDIIPADDFKGKFGWIFYLQNGRKEEHVFYPTCPVKDIEKDNCHPLRTTYEIAYSGGCTHTEYDTIRDKNIKDIINILTLGKYYNNEKS